MSDHSNIAELAHRLEANEIAAWRSMYAAPSPQVSKQLGLGYTEQSGALLVWNRAAPVLLLNRLLGLGVAAAATDDLIDSLLGRANAGSGCCRVQVAPIAEPKDLAERLQARGLSADPDLAAHYRSLAGQLPQPVVPRGYRIEQVTPASAPTWADALLASWGLSARTAAGGLSLMLAIVGEPGWTCYAAIDEQTGLVAGGATMFVANGVGGCYSDGVRPEHRRRRLQAALLATRLAEARRQGCDLVCSFTLTDDTAHRNMLRAGFKLAYARPNYSMTRQA